MQNNKLFCYGILKRGYELDLTELGAKFLGEAHIEGATLFGIGRYMRRHRGDREFAGVGLKLSREGEFSTAHGELFEIPDSLWSYLDDIENNGVYYTRKIVEVQVVDKDGAGVTPVDAWVYEHNYNSFIEDQIIKGGVF
jgi:gamma-glutamylcyclotransferase (GGCT)/AIG2-like uncharacterized protein YtfP